MIGILLIQVGTPDAPTTPALRRYLRQFLGDPRVIESPFVRKVMIVAHERGLAGRITCIRTVAATAKPHAELMKDNPLSKIPTLVLDDGTVIDGSREIVAWAAANPA